MVLFLPWREVGEAVLGRGWTLPGGARIPLHAWGCWKRYQGVSSLVPPFVWGHSCPHRPSSASAGPHAAPFPPYPPCLAQEHWDGGAWSGAGGYPLPSAPHSGALLQHLPCFRGRGGSRAGCDPLGCLPLWLLSLIPQPPFQGCWGCNGGGGFPMLEGAAPLQAVRDPKGSTQEGSG